MAARLSSCHAHRLTVKRLSCSFALGAQSHDISSVQTGSAVLACCATREHALLMVTLYLA
eukprot:1146840-Pelagomonas_calceolata.AAC.7